MAESEQKVVTPRKLTTEDLIHGLNTPSLPINNGIIWSKGDGRPF